MQFPKSASPRAFVADPLHDRDTPLRIKFVERRQRRIEADPVVEFEHRIFGDSDNGTDAMIVVVGPRNDRVEPVVSAAHLHHDQDVGRIDRPPQRRQRLGVGGAHECGRQGAAQNGDTQ